MISLLREISKQNIFSSTKLTAN